ncbi:hypothetical protein L9F63_023345, partial [Diploptera punctata]
RGLAETAVCDCINPEEDTVTHVVYNCTKYGVFRSELEFAGMEGGVHWPPSLEYWTRMQPYKVNDTPKLFSCKKTLISLFTIALRLHSLSPRFNTYNKRSYTLEDYRGLKYDMDQEDGVMLDDLGRDKTSPEFNFTMTEMKSMRNRKDGESEGDQDYDG